MFKLVERLCQYPHPQSCNIIHEGNFDHQSMFT